jgi:hypothetical protein
VGLLDACLYGGITRPVYGGQRWRFHLFLGFVCLYVREGVFTTPSGYFGAASGVGSMTDKVGRVGSPTGRRGHRYLF